MNTKPSARAASLRVRKETVRDLTSKTGLRAGNLLTVCFVSELRCNASKSYSWGPGPGDPYGH